MLTWWNHFQSKTLRKAIWRDDSILETSELWALHLVLKGLEFQQPKMVSYLDRWHKRICKRIRAIVSKQKFLLTWQSTDGHLILTCSQKWDQTTEWDAMWRSLPSRIQSVLGLIMRTTALMCRVSKHFHNSMRKWIIICIKYLDNVFYSEKIKSENSNQGILAFRIQGSCSSKNKEDNYGKSLEF